MISNDIQELEDLANNRKQTLFHDYKICYSDSMQR
jgi:hypothetical protein